jgi:hypothetical protein
MLLIVQSFYRTDNLIPHHFTQDFVDVYSGLGLDRITVYSRLGLDMFYCIYNIFQWSQGNHYYSGTLVNKILGEMMWYQVICSVKTLYNQ